MTRMHSSFPATSGYRPKSIIVWASVAFLIAACATVPITGRSQLMLVTDDQIIRASTASFNSFMVAASQKKAIVRESDSPEAARALTGITRIGHRILQASGIEERYKWDIILVKSTASNAMVMPTGKIIVFSSLLSITQNEGQLAAVIGHEVAHVVARHKAERLSQVLLSNALLSSVDAALTNSKYRPMITSALGLGVQYAVLLPYSREHESEADHIGLLYMAKAGYEPSEAIRLWERMEASDRHSSLDFFSSHPSHESRRAQIKAWLPEAMVYYNDPTRPLPSNLAELEKTVAATREGVSAPEAMRPKYPVGFWYRAKLSNKSEPVTSRYEQDVPCGNRTCMKLILSNGETSLQTLEGEIVELRKSDNSSVKFEPPMRLSQFPLRVGNKWSQVLNIKTSAGAVNSVRVTGSVVAYESITVPAGTFMAFKTIVSVNGQRFRTSWWAPETGTGVRVEIIDRDQTVVGELLEYQQTADPAGAF